MDNGELNKDYKQNAFKVPENYFETFDDKVMERLYQKQKKRHVIGRWQKYGIAASLFFVAAVAVFIYMDRSPETVDLASANVSETELENFHDEAEVNDDEFLELLSTQAVDSIYRLEVISVSDTHSDNAEIENIEEEYSPLDEIEI